MNIDKLYEKMKKNKSSNVENLYLIEDEIKRIDTYGEKVVNRCRYLLLEINENLNKIINENDLGNCYFYKEQRLNNNNKVNEEVFMYRFIIEYKNYDISYKLSNEKDKNQLKITLNVNKINTYKTITINDEFYDHIKYETLEEIKKLLIKNVLNIEKKISILVNAKEDKTFDEKNKYLKREKEKNEII